MREAIARKYLEMHLDPKLKDRGYSGVIAFEDFDGYVNIGCTNEGGKTRYDRMHVVLFPVSLIDKSLEVHIWGGPKEVAEWKALPDTTEAKSQFMYTLYFRGITPETLSDLVCNAILCGRAAGAAKVQKDLREALGL